MAAAPRRRRLKGTSIQEQIIQECYEYLDERLIRLIENWKGFKSSYVHFSSSITLAYPLCKSLHNANYPFAEVTSLDVVRKCYDAMMGKNYTESAYLIANFLQIVEELKHIYDELENCRPTLVASQDNKKARHVRDFCVELEDWRKLIESDAAVNALHHEVETITNDKDSLKQTGRVFSVVPVMIDHAISLIGIMRTGWPHKADGPLSLQRPRTGCIVSSARLQRVPSIITSKTQRSFDGTSGNATLIPQDAGIKGQSVNHLSNSSHAVHLPSIGSVTPRRGSVSDDDDGPLSSRRSSLSFSSSSAYETGPASLSHVSITNSNVTISSDTESTQVSPIDKRPIVKEITEALQSKFDEELDKVTTRLEKKITNATENLRDDIQNDLQQRDKRIDKIKSDVDQLSKFVDEKFSGLDIELLKVDVILKDYVRPLDDELIHVISQNIGPQVYPKLARELGMRQPQIEWIQQRHRDDEHEVVIAILHKWKQIAGMRKATVEAIIRALVKIDQRPTANQILLALKEN
ncbi:uncharacterized protein [Ptychodera flava]|uniref:uncharacterized protein n=1 Tax=Ptychodera flava TaxID=63121 RepID=UPI00396A45BF